MTSGRLFEILYYLLDVKQTTAPQLAEHFEVSIRTIYRDLDRLLVAGIPIVTQQGIGGGISIDEQFVLEKTLLDSSQQEQILLALQGLSSLHLNEYENLLQHMKSVFQKETQNWIEVDLTSWHQNHEINEKFEILKKAILQHLVIEFDYINMQGIENHRIVNPLKIFFKGNSWYLQAFERDREVYRTYKLTRMNQITTSHEKFHIQAFTPIPQIKPFHQETKQIEVELFFQKNFGSFVYDEFEYKDIQEQDNGYLVKTQLSNHQWLLSFLLSFGQGVKVIRPKSLQNEIKQEIVKMLDIYK